MDTQPKSQTPEQSNLPQDQSQLRIERVFYHPPQLTIYGDLRNLTLGTSLGSDESGLPMTGFGV